MNYDVRESGFYIINKTGDFTGQDDYYDQQYLHCKNSSVSISGKEKRYWKSIFKNFSVMPKKILDVGCGLGKASEFFSFYDNNYIGIDFSKGAISLAKEKYPNASFLCASAINLPFQDESFDFIVCSGSLEHFSSMREALGEMKRTLKNNGKIYLELPNLFFLGYYVRYVGMKKSPWSGQPFERLAGVDSYMELFKNVNLNIIKYWGLNYRRRSLNFMVYALWNLGQYFLPKHLKENHCFILEK